jgi:hypothetical protein
MAGRPDSAFIDLGEVFRRVQTRMLAQLDVGKMFEHATSAGNASERHWLRLFKNYLPHQYCAAPAFIIDADGGRSRQIDIAIFDNFSSAPLFPHAAGIHIPVESVYAVFEVKPAVSRATIRDAEAKAASVRELDRRVKGPWGRRDILTGLLGATSDWTPRTYPTKLRDEILAAPLDRRLHLGCALAHGSFERIESGAVNVSDPHESLVFFVMRLLDRLRRLGPAPPVDLMKYVRGLRSFSPKNPE